MKSIQLHLNGCNEKLVDDFKLATYGLIPLNLTLSRCEMHVKIQFGDKNTADMFTTPERVTVIKVK